MKEYQCSLEENEKLEQQNGDPRQQWMAAVDCGQQKISHLSNRQSFSCKLLRQIELSYCHVAPSGSYAWSMESGSHGI